MKYLLLAGALLCVVANANAQGNNNGNCDGVDCSGYGNCVLLSPNRHYCDCDPGVTGENCETTVQRCGCEDEETFYCNVCDDTDQAACDANAVWTACPQSDPVCEEEEHTNVNGQVFRFRRHCMQRIACERRSLGPASRLCNQELDNTICRWCAHGDCRGGPCDLGEDLYCFTCKARDEVACWIAGHYEKCNAGETCFHEHTVKIPGHRGYHKRGCRDWGFCAHDMIGYDNYHCNSRPENLCQNCDCGLLPLTLVEPEWRRHHCGLPPFGICYCKGDPHCRTFDGVVIDQLPVGCVHTLARDNCVDGQANGTANFQIDIEIEPLTDPTRCAIAAITITYNDDVLVFTKATNAFLYTNDGDPSVSVILNGGPISPPGFTGTVWYNAADEVVVLNLGGIIVKWNFQKEVAVIVPDSMLSKMCGICGDYNNDLTNDLIYGPSETTDCPANVGRGVSFPEGDVVPLPTTVAGIGDFAMTWYVSNTNNAQCNADCGV